MRKIIYLCLLIIPQSILCIDPPPNLIATAGIIVHIRLDWQPPDGESPFYYNIYRDGVYFDNTYEIDFIDDEIFPNQEYCYYVTSVDHSENESIPSNTECMDWIIYPPTNLTASPGEYSVILEWDLPDFLPWPMNNYVIFRNGSMFEIIDFEFITSYEDQYPDVLFNLEYCYIVYLNSDIGLSLPSNEACIILFECLNSADLNMDFNLDVLDLILLVTCIQYDYDCSCADLNTDGLVDILDIMLVVQEILVQ
jgi:hypothetical protein